MHIGALDDDDPFFGLYGEGREIVGSDDIIARSPIMWADEESLAVKIVVGKMTGATNGAPSPIVLIEGVSEHRDVEEARRHLGQRSAHNDVGLSHEGAVDCEEADITQGEGRVFSFDVDRDCGSEYRSANLQVSHQYREHAAGNNLAGIEAWHCTIF